MNRPTKEQMAEFVVNKNVKKKFMKAHNISGHTMNQWIQEYKSGKYDPNEPLKPNDFNQSNDKNSKNGWHVTTNPLGIAGNGPLPSIIIKLFGFALVCQACNSIGQLAISIYNARKK